MKPSLTRIARRLQRRRAVGEQRPLVADDLQLHHVGHPQLARQPAGADGLLGGVAAGGVGQERVPLAVDGVEHVGLAGRQVDAAERDGHDLGARAPDRLAPLLDRPVLAGADQQARVELPAAQHQRVVVAGCAARRSRRPSHRPRTPRSRSCRRRPGPPRPRSCAGRRPGCARPRPGPGRPPWPSAGRQRWSRAAAARCSPLTVKRSSFMCGSEA